MKTLLVWISGSNLYRSQEFEVCDVAKGVEMWQQRWVELIKDYNYSIEYHPGKANAVSDALNRKSKVVMDEPIIWDEKTLIELKRFGAILNVSSEGSLMAQLRVKSGYQEQILKAQQIDDKVKK
jgi:hypothetical protein